MNNSRMQWEAEKETPKKGFIIRKQQEREDKKAMEDFMKHYKEEFGEEGWGLLDTDGWDD